ncbi:MAG: MFS transporter [Opitutae bacterium]|nr:MFS transporter [Opitutae bacterium]
MRDMLVLGLMAATFDAEIILTNNIVPITCRHFTDSAFIISAIIASKRLFGSLIQPWACWRSDFVQTRFGRRRPFLLIGLPAGALALLGVGLMPFLIQSDAARHTVLALAAVLLINSLLQIAVDLNWGVLEPLYADTFRQEQLGRASSIRQIASKLLTLFMVSFVIGWADFNELYPYLFGAGVMLLAFALVATSFRETPVELPPAQTGYNLFTHIGKLLGNADLVKVAIVCTGNLALPAALSLLTPLYVTETLGLSMTALGTVQILGVFLAVVLAFPLGWLIDYVGAKWVMAAGFALYAVASAGLALWTHDYPSLFIYMTLFGIAQTVALMPMTAMVFQYSAPHERGHIFGVIQFCRAFSAFVISIALGSIVQLVDSYEPMSYRTQDMKAPVQLAVRLNAPKDDVTRYVSTHLSPETLKILAQTTADSKPTPALSEALAADLDHLLQDSALYTPERFAGVDLSRQGRRLIGEKPGGGDRLTVLNRTLLHDAFPAEISRKVNYRLPYYISVGLALFAMVVALTARRGPYAKTLADKRA